MPLSSFVCPCSEATQALAGHLRQELAGLLTQVT